VIFRLVMVWSVMLALAFDMPAVAQELAESDIRVGPGDVVKLRVYGQPDLSDQYEISPDGALTIPGLGRIPNLKRLSQVRTGVDKLIDANSGLPETHFAVSVALRPVTVSGDVQSPGEVPYTFGLRVAQAIALVGGPSKYLSNDKLGRLIQVNQERERLAIAKFRLARALISEARLRGEHRDEAVFEVPAQALDLIGSEQAARLAANESLIAQSNARANEIARSRVTAAAEINVNDIRAQKLSRDSLESQLDLVREDLERLTPLIEKRAVTGDRILNLRLDIAQIEGFVGQAVATLARSETEQAVLSEEDLLLDVQRQLTIVSQLIAVEAEIMDASASIEAISGSLRSARDLPSLGNLRDRGPGNCKVSILRTKDNGDPIIIAADVLTVLDPGDHVEIGPIISDCDSPFFK
jgi:polysaccharide biosynthesis/export protein ExoF